MPSTWSMWLCVRSTISTGPIARRWPPSSGPGSTATRPSMIHVLVPSRVMGLGLGASTCRTYAGNPTPVVTPRCYCDERTQFRRRPLLHVHFDDDFDLDGGAQRQLGDADRAAGVLARFAEDLAEQLGGPVDHAGLAGEALGAGHEAGQLHDPDDLVQADQGVHRRHRVERA